MSISAVTEATPPVSLINELALAVTTVAGESAQSKAQHLVHQVDQAAFDTIVDLGASPESKAEYYERLKADRQAEAAEREANNKARQAQQDAQRETRAAAEALAEKDDRVRLAYSPTEPQSAL